MLLLLIVSLCATYLFYLYTKRQQRLKELRDVIARRLIEREESIALAEKSAELVALGKREEIAKWNFQELRENLQEGTVTCVEVLRTFQWKAIMAHKKTNCITLFIQEAERWAADWDAKAAEPGFKKPVFFGIPISLKECIAVKGYDTTRGLAQDVSKPSDFDSVLVQQIKLLGFIPFVQTNVSQLLMSYGCSNPIYGATSSPLDSSRTSGGSSGGESALLAANGSVIGIGGDVGGSIRVPCHFTGTAGIKVS
ncbi:Amidase [Necator americanus]|uniref:Amidase n=1 Tax=Necator americanus TaxID=51031 RepID=W2TCH3_NECAM|nr:Amidase [Necator americanus]ETN79543.1 Amidase [Necator americanus]